MASDLSVVGLRSKRNGEFVEQRVSELQALVDDKVLANVVIVGVTSTGDIVDAWANTDDPYAVIGALTAMIHDFRNAAIEPRDGQS